MAIDRLRRCETVLHKALQRIQAAADFDQITQIYEEARTTVASVVGERKDKSNSDAVRELLSLMVYVHLAYRTKQADVQDRTRVLAVR